MVAGYTIDADVTNVQVSTVTPSSPQAPPPAASVTTSPSSSSSGSGHNTGAIVGGVVGGVVGAALLALLALFIVRKTRKPAAKVLSLSHLICHLLATLSICHSLLYASLPGKVINTDGSTYLLQDNHLNLQGVFLMSLKGHCYFPQSFLTEPAQKQGMSLQESTLWALEACLVFGT